MMLILQSKWRLHGLNPDTKYGYFFARSLSQTVRREPPFEAQAESPWWLAPASKVNGGKTSQLLFSLVLGIKMAGPVEFYFTVTSPD